MSDGTSRYEGGGYILAALIKAVEEIGEYGEEKYGSHSFQAAVKRGDRTRPTERHSTGRLLLHAAIHMSEARHGVPHDHFGTVGHQYAAAVFNIMMEFYFAGLDMEDADRPPAPPATAAAPNPIDEDIDDL